MGSALIDVMRARFAPSRLSRSWSQALRLTEAETFARQVSLRWEQAAAELEELIRARVWEPALEDTAEMEDPGSAGASPARFDRGGAHPRAREAGPPRAEDPARRMRFSPVGEAFPERPLVPTARLSRCFHGCRAVSRPFWSRCGTRSSASPKLAGL